MSKSIRVEKDTHAALAALKAEDESFDDLLSRLLRECPDSVDSEAGLWEGTDAANGARNVHS